MTTNDQRSPSLCSQEQRSSNLLPLNAENLFQEQDRSRSAQLFVLQLVIRMVTMQDSEAVRWASATERVAEQGQTWWNVFSNPCDIFMLGYRESETGHAED